MNNISSAHSDGHDSFVLLRGKEQTSWTVRLLHVLTAQLDVVLKKCGFIENLIMGLKMKNRFLIANMKQSNNCGMITEASIYII